MTEYTMKLLDQAISNILGEDVFKALMYAFSSGRITAHRLAMEKAFMQKLDNTDTDIIRSANADLLHGQYQPVGGFND